MPSLIDVRGRVTRVSAGYTFARMGEWGTFSGRPVGKRRAGRLVLPVPLVGRGALHDTFPP